MGDTTPYAVFFSRVPADLLKMELDLAWVTKAGVDPVALFREHPGRFPLWHVKDIAADLLPLRPVGQGSIDFKRIFREPGGPAWSILSSNTICRRIRWPACPKVSAT